MLPDITTRADIEFLLASFYEQAFADAVIGYIFTDITRLDLNVHLPVIADFWEDLLLGSQQYSGNPVKIHQHIDRLSRLNSNHFTSWLSIWEQTIDAHFTGNKATEARQRANNIAKIMILKIEQGRY